MANWLLDGLADVGYALDTPGAYLRGALAGNPGGRASGEDLLSSYGVDAGPLGGLAAEMVVDPLTLLPPVYGAYKGVKALSGAGDMAPAMRRLGELGSSTALDRRLGELGRSVDPLDRLRMGYRDTEGAANPLADALGRFAEDESGALDMDGLARMFGGDREAARVAAVQGPGYPGGAEKLDDIFRQTGSGPRAAFADVLRDPLAAKYVASEIPPGSRFLGHGMQATAFEAPTGHVIRVSGSPLDDPVMRLDIPQMLQPFRSVYKGGHTIEHLPRMRGVDRMVDDTDVIGDLREVMDPSDPRDIAAIMKLYEARSGATRAVDAASGRALEGLESRGIYADDWGTNNVGVTEDGGLAAFDPGVFSLGEDAMVASNGPFRTSAPGDFRRQVRARGAVAGSPEYIREAIERDAAAGGFGQGVFAPELEAARPDTDLMERLLEAFGMRQPTRDAWQSFRGTLGVDDATETALDAYRRMARGRASGSPFHSDLQHFLKGALVDARL